MHFKNTFLMGHNSQERNSVANKPTQLVCPVFLRFTVFPCLIARTIWPNLACWWILFIWANWVNSATFCILCRLTVSTVCNFSFNCLLTSWLFNHLSYLSWLCFLSDETLTLSRFDYLSYLTVEPLKLDCAVCAVKPIKIDMLFV